MFKDVISLIKPLDAEAMHKCQLRLDNLTKPLNSLHSFEHMARQIAGITRNPRPRILKKSIVIMAGDHGVSAEGVNPFQQEATAQRISNFCNGRAVINVFAEHVSASLVLIDIGVEEDLPLNKSIHHEKITYGTKNITQSTAMTREQAFQAIKVGIKIACEEIEKGVQVLGLGEMSFGSIVSGIAMAACYSPLTLEELIGCATGMPDENLNKLLSMVETALAVNSPDKNDPLDVLSKVGGLEIAGLVGAILGAVSRGAAVVLDGLITSVAALIAVKMAPSVKDYLIASHYSAEPAHKAVLEMIGTPAYLHLDMSLGEGTGAVLGMSLINASLHVLNDMKTFGEAEVAVAQDGPGARKQNKYVRD